MVLVAGGIAGEPGDMAAVDNLWKLLAEADTELDSLREHVDEACAVVKSQ